MKGGGAVTTARYDTIKERLGASGAAAVRVGDRTLTALIYIAYPAMIGWRWAADGAVPWRELWVPASWLVIVSLLRVLIDRPRPYEQPDFVPLIRREEKGKSFPSRHVFSAAVIAVTGAYIWPPLGILLGALAALLAATRVLGGVHHPADVIAGAAIGAAAGIVGYWII